MLHSYPVSIWFVAGEVVVLSGLYNLVNVSVPDVNMSKVFRSDALCCLYVWFRLVQWSCFFLFCLMCVKYWICEHSTIVKPETENIFPKFLKWDIGALVSRMLRSLEYERDISATDKGLVTSLVGNICDSNVNNLGDGSDINIDGDRGRLDVADNFVEKRVRMAHPSDDGMQVKSNDVYNPVHNTVNDVAVGTEVEKALNPMADIEMRNKANEGMIAKLDEEVVRLKSKMELQVMNIVCGFECVMKVKDEEIRKLQNENKEFWQTILILEDQLADHQMHNVMQAFRKVDVSVVDLHTMSDSSPMSLRSMGDVSLSDHEVQVLPYVADGGYGVAGQNWFVRKIKTKVRKELRLKDYDNPLGWERGKRIVTHMDEGLEVDKCNVNYDVIDVDMLACLPENGLVINTYADILLTKQANVGSGDDLLDKSYFFSSICMKERVFSVMKRSLRANGIDEQSIDETFNHLFESIADCPQQRVDSLDCAVIVCAVIRQYVHNLDVGGSLQGNNDIVLRANMVKGFVNDTIRGLKD
ncbi:hypothetical protein LOK49_LG13G01511 [Camellia lanceoleosa]|uniref:Uncharacterized protein n=1 Tax=Camellia lanceoleosa TaxID=1840588 RepID=A0ACC0FGW3_9ERIC|nr:hypothetical protein LOK49_LG13G01511 [Camellia lanceoleosa]